MLSTGIRALLIDLDGVLYVGRDPVPGAREAIGFLQENGYRYRFVSNTTRKCRAAIARHLQGMGFPVDERQILTPAVAAADRLRRQGVRECFFLTAGDVVRDFESAGIAAGEGADVVVVGDAGDNFTYGSMNRAFRRILDGAEILALEKDRYWMSPEGLALSAGPFVAALEYASGREATLIGKPSEAFFSEALRQISARAEETSMIGDDIVTDVGGAQRCGMQGILVQTGKYRREAAEKCGIVPEAVLPSIASLPAYLR
ncbi:MAG: TIGR01458 family HAD-type hydrolase [Methanomicrobiales archaeon]|nr:TIGR01458 family HAD-type hydrolase [Methanomicrobiales archaeon]